MSCSADFAAAGPAYQRADRILVNGCEIPCSLEVFREELEEMRRQSRSPITPEMCAETVARSYQRTKS